MNSTDKRIEELLNRAGQTISDLPKSDGKHLTYSLGQRQGAEHEVFAFARQSVFADIFDILALHQDYILHLTDIIDRLETTLENVCNERDYLAYRLRRYRDCQSCERVNECERTPDHCLGWVFGGVPEDWSVGDD